MNKRNLILKQAFGGADLGLTPPQLRKVETAMEMYKVSELNEYRNRQLKEDMITLFQLILNFTWDNATIWARYQVYKRASKQAKLRMRTEGYKMYVVRESRLNYKVISSLDVKYNKRLKVMRKEVTAKDLEKIAALVVHEDGTTTGLGFSEGHVLNDLIDSEQSGTNLQKKKKRTLKRNKN